MIFINGLSDGILSICKIFADDTFRFSKIHDIDVSAKESNSELEKNSKRDFHWKIQFNPDPNKLVNEVIFSKKSNNCSHPPVTFNNNDINKYPNHKHLEVFLDLKPDLKFHVDKRVKKCNKLICLLRRLSVSVPRKALLTIYKSFIRLHLDYGDTLYNKLENIK